MRLPFFIAAFALTLAVGVFALAGRGGQVVAQEPEPTPDPCMTEEPTSEPTQEPTTEPTMEPTVEPTAEGTTTATESTTADTGNAIKVSSNNGGTVNEDPDAVLQAECDDTEDEAETVTGETPIVDPRNFPIVGGRVDPLPPAAQVETSSPARAEADAARAAAAAASQQPAALPATGMGAGEASGGLDQAAALGAVVLLGLSGVTALAARCRES